jgi:hypothetical protein
MHMRVKHLFHIYVACILRRQAHVYDKLFLLQNWMKY